MAIIPIVENNYVGDGTTRIYDTTFVYLDRTDVYATVGGEPVAFTWLSDSSNQVELVVAPEAGVEIRIYRSTKAIEPRYEFTQGIPVLPRYIDENNRQLLYAVQEGIAATADTAAQALDIARDTAAILEEAIREGVVVTLPILASRQALAAATIPASITAVDVQAYHAGTGVGGARYSRFVPSSETNAIVARINTAIGGTLEIRRVWAIERAIRRLRGAGLLAPGKLGSLVELSGAGQAQIGAALVDWMRPAATVSTSGAVQYIPGKGVKLSGAGSISLGGAPDALGITLNSAHSGMFVAGTTDEDYVDNTALPLIGGGSRLGVSPSNLLGGMSVALNTNTAVAVGRHIVGRAGHSIANRPSASTVQAFRDGELHGSAASAVQQVSASPVIFGGWTTPNLYGTDTVGYVHHGGSLTASEARALYDIMQEYRHIVSIDADPGALLQSQDGGYWELATDAAPRTPYQYGADEVDDTAAFRNACALQQDVYLPTPRQCYRVVDGVKVLARIRSNWATVRLDVNTPYSRCFDMQDRSAIERVAIEFAVNTSTAPSEGGQHCAVLLGRFHATQSPIRDVVVDVRVNLRTLAPAAVYLIGNVVRPVVSYEVTGEQVNGAAFLAHWGSSIDPTTLLEHTIQRPRQGHITSGVARSTVTSGHRGFYFSGVSDWVVDYLECHNFTAPFGVAPGDKPNAMDAACHNSTQGKLLYNLVFGRVLLENPAGIACQMWGRTAFIDGARWYSTDRTSAASTVIRELTIRRGPNTPNAIMLDIDIGAYINIPALSITNGPGTLTTTIQGLEPAVRVRGGLNVSIAGRVVSRWATELGSCVGVDIDIAAENPVPDEINSQSAGKWLTTRLATGQLTAPLAVGATSISFLRSPAIHIVPGMEFEVAGVRYVFASSQAGDNLLDDNVTMQIEPAPAAIASGVLVTCLGGPTRSTLRGSEYGYYRGIVSAGSDSRIPNNITIIPDIRWCSDDGIELDAGCGYFIQGGVFDYNNRSGGATGSDIRINANVRDVHVHGARFAPSPGSRRTTRHILANAGTSGIIARDNYGYGVTGAGPRFSIPTTGADGKPNVNTNYEF